MSLFRFFFWCLWRPLRRALFSSTNQTLRTWSTTSGITSSSSSWAFLLIRVLYCWSSDYQWFTYFQLTVRWAPGVIGALAWRLVSQQDIRYEIKIVQIFSQILVIFDLEILSNPLLRELIFAHAKMLVVVAVSPFPEGRSYFGEIFIPIFFRNKITIPI